MTQVSPLKALAVDLKNTDIPSESTWGNTNEKILPSKGLTAERAYTYSLMI
jgi:hypothetical protein